MNKKEQEIKTEVPFVDFEFGDLYIGCSCGNEELFISGIEGIQLEPLVATNKHTLKIVCSKCKHELWLFYKEAAEIEKLKAERDARINAVQEAEVINEVKEENESGDIESA